MKFCSHCGAPLQGDERFCVACGTPVSGNPRSAFECRCGRSANTCPPMPLPLAAPMGVPTGYAVPGSIPVVVGPPHAPANHAGKVWVGIFIVVVLWRELLLLEVEADSRHNAAGNSGTAGTRQPGAPAQPGTAGQPATMLALAQQQSVRGPLEGDLLDMSRSPMRAGRTTPPL